MKKSLFVTMIFSLCLLCSLCGNKADGPAEEVLSKRKEVARTEMAKQEEKYNKLKERERKKYEKEYQKRMKKIYGQQMPKKESKSNLAELRKKIMASKLSSVPASPKPVSRSKPISKINTLISTVPQKKNSFAPQNRSPTPIQNAFPTVVKAKPIVPAKGSFIPCLRPKK